MKLKFPLIRSLMANNTVFLLALHQIYTYDFGNFQQWQKPCDNPSGRQIKVVQIQGVRKSTQCKH
jgi:hypothetical protein